jgi:formylglycine-generating enzyme required for sulfatase activity
LSLVLPIGAFSVHAAEKTYTNSIGMEFVLIPAGSFTMGADKNFEKALDSETPQHRVTISKPFYLGKYEVTQAQWEMVMGNNPSEFKGRSNPVEQVSWNDAQVFIQHLNRQEGHNRYRLPTEAEWELAARGGTDTMFFFMKDPQTWEDASRKLDAYAWFGGNSGRTTHPVGEKKPNPYGLHDVYGNVWEWVQDWYGDLPQDREIVDYHGPSDGSYRGSRGGCWADGSAEDCRSDGRGGSPPDDRNCGIGFRLALSPE